MSSIAPYLKKLDAEIMRLRQEIAVRQLEIHRIEESRLTIMSIEQRSASVEVSSLDGLLNGTSYDQRPALIVREAATGGEDGSASRAAKLGLNAAGNRRGMNQKVRERASPGEGKHHQYKDKILKLLKENPKSEFAFPALIERMGLGPLTSREKQPLYQALWAMRKDGLIKSPMHGSYQIANP